MMIFRTGEWAFGANLENMIHRHVFLFFFLTVLFGDFELVRDSQNPSDKETFFCFLPRFLNTKYLRVMELRDTKFIVKGRPMGSCRWSSLWLVLAQHGALIRNS